jgi:hypothetical protein
VCMQWLTADMQSGINMWRINLSAERRQDVCVHVRRYMCSGYLAANMHAAYISDSDGYVLVCDSEFCRSGGSFFFEGSGTRTRIKVPDFV